MEANVDFWNLIWKVIVGTGVVAGALVSIFVILDQLRPFWSRRFWLRRNWPWLGSSPRGTRDFVTLLKVLGKVQEKIGSIENEEVAKDSQHNLNKIYKDIRHSLNKTFWGVWVEAMSCIALHSIKEKERCLALRNLSQVEDDKFIEHILCVVRGVLNDPHASAKVTRVAGAALEELEERIQKER